MVMNASMCVLLQLVCTLHCTISAVRVCTDPSNLKHVINGVRLEGYNFKTLAADGVMACAQQCRNRARCKSFNFDTDQSLCDLNEAETIPDGLVAQIGSFHSNVSDYPEVLSGSCTHHDCSLNERCESDDGGSYTCIPEFPSSCVDVRTCSPGSTDGEYWIYLTNMNMVRVPIYCHNMGGSPVEYVTLREVNQGVFPQRSNIDCGGEQDELFGSCVGQWGDVSFGKINVHIQTLEVVQDHYTFADYTNIPHIYGVAQDCYSMHESGQRSACGPVGTFTLDLRGTAFAVASEVRWEPTGYKSYSIVDRSSDSRQVDMLCGGYPGYCEPKPSLRLVPSTTDVPLTNATEVWCEL